ncbi:MAG: hypothetical protein WCF18_07010 [Chthoniobacteraceae bacterium]
MAKSVPNAAGAVTASNKVTFAAVGANNPGGLTLSINSKSGLVTGSFKLSDPNPEKAGATLVQERMFRALLRSRCTHSRLAGWIEAL